MQNVSLLQSKNLKKTTQKLNLIQLRIMTKEQKIKEAWGNAYEEIKGMLAENGYILSIDLAHSNLNLSIFGLDLNYNDIGVRPKSLQRIENNNGWIKIESEEDLPKDSFNYWLMCNDGRLINMKEYDYYKQYIIPDLKATHYQPIQKPKPPIY